MDYEIIPSEPEPERQYSTLEIQTRDRFVREYILDYDFEAAAMRTGYSRAYARQMAQLFMDEPYVQRKIKELELCPMEGTVEDQKAAQDRMQKEIIRGLMREANNRGPGSSAAARVAALSKLASLHGMDQPIRTKNEHTGADGAALEGVFIVPGVVTTDDWAKMAAAQQDALVSATTMVTETKH